MVSTVSCNSNEITHKIKVYDLISILYVQHLIRPN